MPRGRKKKELSSLQNGLQKTNIVQKSRPLFELWRSDLTLSEFKILDTYLSRIDSHHPENRSVVFNKGKLEELLGVKQIRPKDLDTRLSHLQKTVVDLGNGEDIDRITLFERAQGVRDETGSWQVTLTCTPSAMKYIFDIEHLGYLRYQIRSITQLTSLYSYILFTYLEYNRFRKSWVVPLEELKNTLNCTDESYKEYKIFNNRILKHCHKELSEKTELTYSYEPIRQSRRVAAIRFTLGTLSDQILGQMSFDDFVPASRGSASGDMTEAYSSERLAFLAEACEFEFTEPEMQVLMNLLIQLVPYDNLNGQERYHYLKQKYDILQMYSAKRKIASRYNYLRKMLEEDLLEQKI